VQDSQETERRLVMKISHGKDASVRITAPWRVQGLLVLVAATMLMAGCAVEIQNTLPAKELERMAQPPGSVYMGWRVFQDKCATCHGPTANGTTGAPDLLPIVRTMGPRQFVGLVLTRYDWVLPVARGNGDRAAREAQVDTVLQRGEAPLVMPAWGSEPRVNAHILDLHAYLTARAQGAQGPERPLP
jgi:mono/diheme cytochrome c family protein